MRMRVKITILISIVLLLGATIIYGNEPGQGDGDRSSSKSPVESSTFIIDISPLGIYQTGGGDTHDGDETVGFNSGMSLDLEYCILDGFALGLTGGASYTTTTQVVNLSILGFPVPVEIEGKATIFSVGPVFSYYYPVTNSIIFFATLFYTYGYGDISAGPLGSQKLYTHTIGLKVGVNFMITENLGFYVGLNHNRDWVDAGGATNNGYLTGATLGLKVFL